jgi:hypothetical protein
MTLQEAKFILSSYRPNGSDSGSAAFGDALRMAGEDPVLGAWFARSRELDTAVAAKLAQIAPPPGLREAILAGARVGESHRKRGPAWGWMGGLAAAAALVIGLFSLRVPVRPVQPSIPSSAQVAPIAVFAIDDMVHGKHGGSGEPASALVARLETKGSAIPTGAEIGFDKLKATGCRTISWQGEDMIEVCFVRDGTLFHLYVLRRPGPGDDDAVGGPFYLEQAAGSAASWSDSHFDYALASTAGVAAIRKLLL